MEAGHQPLYISSRMHDGDGLWYQLQCNVHIPLRHKHHFTVVWARNIPETESVEAVAVVHGKETEKHRYACWALRDVISCD